MSTELARRRGARGAGRFPVPSPALADPVPESGAMSGGPELEWRAQLLTLGVPVGWIAIVALGAGLLLDGGAPRGGLVPALIVAAAAGNAAASCVPWRAWLERRRGRVALDLWSGALIGFVAVVVVTGGARFALLMFVVAPYVALVQAGLRRWLFIALSGVTCAAIAAVTEAPPGQTVMRLLLVALGVAASLVLARRLQSESAARWRAARSAGLERSLAAESNHRIKNSLQLAADLLLLGGPRDGEERAFEEGAARIRTIAALHRLLAEGDAAEVEARHLLASVVATIPVPVEVEVDEVAFDSATAQRLGLVANELLTNAYRHGAQPIALRLSAAHDVVLRVDDDGAGPGSPPGLGLRLVREIVEHGLAGRFALAARPGGGTRAEVVIPGRGACAS